MKRKVLFTYDYGIACMDKVRELGYDVVIKKENKELIYNDEISKVEVLVCYNPFDTLEITKMQKLRYIVLSSAGIDHLPIKQAISANITVTNNKGGYSIPMGEWVVMSILQLYKNSKKLFSNSQKKLWAMDTSVMELFGKTVGFIGTGSIAQEAAKRLKGFAVKILGLNTKGTKTIYFDQCYSKGHMVDFLKDCDVVVVTIPYTQRTHKLLNDEAFKAMKKGVCIINVSRGAIIDEESLIDNLNNGKIRAAALDVFEEEPLSVKSQFWDLPNVIVSPHNSWISEAKNARRFACVLENLKRYANDEELINKVDLIKGY